MRKKGLKIIVGIVFAGIILMPFFINTKTVHALIPPILYTIPVPGTETATKESWTQRLWNKIKEKATEAYRVATDVAFKNSLRVFFGKFAEDTAIWLASAGTGQKPLFLTDPNYWSDLGSATAGDYLYSLGAHTFGVDVCEPDLQAKLSITFALGKTINPKTWCQDKCTWGLNGTVNDINEKYNGPSASTPEVGPSYAGEEGTINYYQYYDSDSTFPQFLSLNKTQFACPITCLDGPPSPGMWCNASFNTGDSTQWEIIPLYPDDNDPLYPNQDDPDKIMAARRNLQACLSTLKSLYNNERKIAQGSYQDCNRNCRLGVRKSKCSLGTVWENVKNLTSSNVLNTMVDTYFQPSQNDIGQLLTIYELVEEKTAKELAREKLLWESPQIGPVTTKVSKEILTPRELVQLRGEMAVEKGTTSEEVRTGSWKADVITIFTNTLIDRLIKRFYGGKCALNPSAEGCKGPSGGSKLSQLIFGSSGPSGIAAAKLKFASISQLNFTRGSPGQDPVATSDLAAKGIIDSGLQTAIDQQMTVKEAIDKGLIGGTFGYDAEGREPSLDSGIPYRTILYLRKYRIVPVTWELAAEWIKNNPQNITLEKLVQEEYGDCETGGKNFCSDTKDACQGNSDCYDQGAYPSCTDNADCVALGFDLCITESDAGRSACYRQCDPSAAATGCGVNEECRSSAVPNLGYCVGTDVPLCQHEVNASPFCGLIDPGWVLKMPATYCQKRGASEEIINKEFICDEDTNADGKTDCQIANGDIGHWELVRNTETCVDEESCLIEDKNGKCLKYGYCFEERPIWRFNGTECSSSVVSCQSYLNLNGQAVSYLKNTVDVNGCDAAVAGCQWYCQEPDYNSATSQWICTRDTGSKINFDRDVQTCQEKESGCQEYVRTIGGTNLVQNSSFEFYTGEVNDSLDDQFNDVWVGNGTAPYTCGAIAQAVSDSYSGSAALKLTQHPAACLPDPLRVLAINFADTGHSVLNRTFTVSFYAKASGYCSTTSRLANGLGGVGWVFYPSQTFNLTPEWQRYSYSVTIDSIALDGSGNPINPNKLSPGLRTSPDCDIYLDAFQLEEGSLTAYKDYGEANKVYLNKDRLACAAKDVGCEKYTPVKGGSAIPGVVYSQNMCSADKVGCQSFRETEIKQIPLRAARDPIYFISGTGTRCDANSVGCEEYTNLDVANQGGEAKEYYRQIRQCVKPDMPAVDIQNFYTWEGSDTKGYQLRAYKLVKSNNSGAPCTNLSIATTMTDPVCEDDALNQATCAAAEMADNPDCTEFYDSAGNVYYILRSRVIKATDQCHPYRNTIDTSDASLANNIYYLIPEESIRCSSSYAGCREYKGNSGRVTRTVFADNFEKTAAGAVNWQTGILSNESTRADEHSLHVLENATATSVDNPNILGQGKLARDRYYQLSFWLKPDGATAINSIAIEQSSNPSLNPQFFVAPASPVTLTQDWNLYTFGPLQFNRDVLLDEQLTLALDGHFFLDNVSLEEVADTFYLIKNTYVSCGASDLGCQAYKDSKGKVHYIKSFDHLCAEKFIGCEAMINTKNYHSPYQTTIKEITIPADSIETIVYKPVNACPAASKGCQKFGLPTLNQADEPVSYETKYLINDPEKYQHLDSQNQDASIVCLAAEEGCGEFIYKEGNGTDWFKDPRAKTCEYKVTGTSDEYKWYKTGTSLLCPVVTPPSSGKPVGRACVRTCTGGTYAGVACVENSDCNACIGGTRAGRSCQVNADCPSGFCQGSLCGGNSSDVGTPCQDNLDCAAGNRCDYWVGLCPEEQSGCNEYRDPADPDTCRTTCSLAELGGKPVPVNDNCEPTVCLGGDKAGQMCYTSMDCPGSSCSGIGRPGCRSYYYLKQSVEENKEECGNQVNVEEGCLPFNDTSNPVLNMRGK